MSTNCQCVTLFANVIFNNVVLEIFCTIFYVCLHGERVLDAPHVIYATERKIIPPKHSTGIAAITAHQVRVSMIFCLVIGMITGVILLKLVITQPKLALGGTARGHTHTSNESNNIPVPPVECKNFSIHLTVCHRDCQLICIVYSSYRSASRSYLKCKCDRQICNVQKSTRTHNGCCPQLIFTMVD